MSRFVEILHRHEREISVDSFGKMLQRDDRACWMPTPGHIEMTFPYFVMKKAPVSGVESLMNYQATIFGEHRDGRTERLAQGGGADHQPVPVLEEDLRLRRAQSALAHHPDGQAERAHVARGADRHRRSARPPARYTEFSSGRTRNTSPSAPTTIRNSSRTRCATSRWRSTRDERVRAYVVESENFESIHNHSAYAMIEHDKEAAASRWSGGAPLGGALRALQPADHAAQEHLIEAQLAFGRHLLEQRRAHLHDGRPGPAAMMVAVRFAPRT